MSKNFELLNNIGNEKDLFQTLDDWEGIDEASVNAEQEGDVEGRVRIGTQGQSPLPDVFHSVDDTLGSVDLVTPDLSCEPEPVQKPIKELLESKARAENQSSTLERGFPLSSNSLRHLSSDLDIPQAWVKPEIGTWSNEEVELELEPETPLSSAIPELQQASERAANSNDTKVHEPSPANKEKKDCDPPHPRPSLYSGVKKGRSIGDSPGSKRRTRSVYRDPRREAIAHEEQLKLVQRIFLAEENSPRMVLFSGFERDTGCASICIRAGEMLASQAEGSVCLVDVGFRVPSLHESCGVQNERGFAEALAESVPIQEFAQQLSPANLWVIPAGYGAPQLNFAKIADRLRARMEELRKTFRFVVVHSGALWLNADAMLLSKWTDGVVLILEAHSTRRDTARRIKESLAAANSRILGVVLNNRTYPIPETLYSRL